MVWYWVVPSVVCLVERLVGPLVGDLAGLKAEMSVFLWELC